MNRLVVRDPFAVGVLHALRKTIYSSMLVKSYVQREAILSRTRLSPFNMYPYPEFCENEVLKLTLSSLDYKPFSSQSLVFDLVVYENLRKVSSVAFFSQVNTNTKRPWFEKNGISDMFGISIYLFNFQLPEHSSRGVYRMRRLCVASKVRQ